MQLVAAGVANVHNRIRLVIVPLRTPLRLGCKSGVRVVHGMLLDEHVPVPCQWVNSAAWQRRLAVHNVAAAGAPPLCCSSLPLQRWERPAGVV